MSLEVGSRVGDYEVLALLGAGGMGRVYKVRNIISNREEAMKILLSDFLSDRDLAARFMVEIRTLAGLEHPNIAQLRTAFQFQNQLVMVMEYVEGTTLESMASKAPIPVDRVIDYSTQVLAALSYAHGKGVTHRDIKPANVMITDHGVVKLMDFGIAKSTNDMQLTRPGTTMGSVYYMSPEQVRGGAVDARSDIYSYGVTLYEMLTGRKPFQAETSYSVLNAQLNEAPTPPAMVNPSLPPELNNIVLRAMVKAPEGRFQTAEEFRSALKALRDPKGAQAAAAAATVVAPPTPAPSSQPGFMPMPVAASPAAKAAAPASGKSNRGVWIGLGAAVAVLAILAAFAVLPRFLAAHAGQKQAPPAAMDSQTPAATTDASTAAQPATPTPEASQPAAPAATTPAPAAAGTAAAPTISPAAIPSRKTRATSVLSAGAQAGSTASSESAPAGPSPQEIREAHDRLANLGARADSARAGVQQIRTQQQAQGLDIRGDILSAMNRMGTDLTEAQRAIDQNNLESAKEYMDRADREISTLEGFLQGR
jgi:eukaryotic-like serine/threonine-protein kinase